MYDNLKYCLNLIIIFGEKFIKLVNTMAVMDQQCDLEVLENLENNML